MKQRRFEIFIAVVLTLICYFGNYYLKEPLIHGIPIYSVTWYIVDILWLFAMMILGYWGLKDHELQWVKTVWIIVNSVLLIVLLANKLTGHYFNHPFLQYNAGAVVKTPFLFLVAAFLPRWLNVHKPSIER